MIRLKRLKPGKFYHVKQDNLKLQVVRVEPPAPNRFGAIGAQTVERFLREDLFLYVESCVAVEHLGLQDSVFVNRAYDDDEKIHHFLVNTRSVWLTSKSLKRMMEHWSAHGPMRVQNGLIV